MSYKPHRIKGIVPKSIAEEMGIEQGDLLLAINGQPINDVLEYKYITNEEYIEVLVQKPCGEQWLLEVDKDVDEDLGLIFEEDIMDTPKRCHNKCIFCFMDQLPKGMRSTLYFKDDDWRLSFLHGNFITLTNLDEDEAERIIKYRISPLNVSVHTTDPHLRVKMLRNPRAARIMDLLELFIKNGIVINCQIVLCPGINDGQNLDRTLRDLGGLWPGVNSIGVVPVGLTRFREGLYPLKSYDRSGSREVLQQINSWQKAFLKDKGSRIVYAADEFYLKAGIPFPPASHYEGFHQLENGVGLIPLFEEQFDRELSKHTGSNSINKKVSVATGVAAYRFMVELSNRIADKFPGIKIGVYRVENSFFGEAIDVSGLVTGGDIIKQLKGREIGDELIIPDNMLKSGEEIFLDGMTVCQVSRALDTKITVCPVDGGKFVKKIL